MPRFITFVFCLAFLCAAGGWAKVGMALFAVVFALLLVYVVCLIGSATLRPPR